MLTAFCVLHPPFIRQQLFWVPVRQAYCTICGRFFAPCCLRLSWPSTVGKKVQDIWCREGGAKEWERTSKKEIVSSAPEGEKGKKEEPSCPPLFPSYSLSLSLSHSPCPVLVLVFGRSGPRGGSEPEEKLIRLVLPQVKSRASFYYY